jgi:hypothetical protein
MMALISARKGPTTAWQEDCRIEAAADELRRYTSAAAQQRRERGQRNAPEPAGVMASTAPSRPGQ